MRTALVLAGAFSVVGCASQSSGPVQLAAGQEGNRCTATVDGRPVVFNTDGRDFSQLRGRAVTIAASGNLPNRCAGILIAALHRAGTGPVTYDFGAAAPEMTAGDEASTRSRGRGADSGYGGRSSFYERASFDERPSYYGRLSFEKRSGSREWRGSTMSNYRSAKSGPPEAFMKERWAGR